MFASVILSKINTQLEKIYQERKIWNGSRGSFSKRNVGRRAVVLATENILHTIKFYADVLETYEKHDINGHIV